MSNDNRLEALEAFRDAVNTVKKVGLGLDALQGETYLGGDLGIDSIEMLEIWYEVEQRLAIQIDDDEKRDIYTVEEVLGVVLPKTGA